MPNIFKNFLRPSVNNYVFPDAESIQVEPEQQTHPTSEPTVEQLVQTVVEQAAQVPEEQQEKPVNEAVQQIEFAKIQAEEIMADARRQAEELLEQMRQEGQKQAEQARKEAQEDGYRQGYAEGLLQAQVESKRVIEEQAQSQAEQVKVFLEKATTAREELLKQAESELCDMSLAIAEKVIHISLKSSREVIARMIQVATEKLKRREWVHIYVGGCEARDLAQITPDLEAALAGLSEHIKIIPMSEDELGTCIIEMPDEIIDVSASTQLNNIRGILMDN